MRTSSIAALIKRVKRADRGPALESLC